MISDVTINFSLCSWKWEVWNLHRRYSNSPQCHLICSIWSFKETRYVYSSIFISRSHCRSFLWTLTVWERLFMRIICCFQIHIILQATNHYFWMISFLMKKPIMVFLKLQFVVFNTWQVSEIDLWKVKWTKNWTWSLIIINYKISDYIDVLDIWNFFKSQFLPNWESLH